MHNRINTRLESKQASNLKYNLLLLLDFLILVAFIVALIRMHIACANLTKRLGECQKKTVRFNALVVLWTLSFLLAIALCHFFSLELTFIGFFLHPISAGRYFFTCRRENRTMSVSKKAITAPENTTNKKVR